LQYITVGHSERFASVSFSVLTNASHVFIMGYCVGGSADVKYPMRDMVPSTILPDFDQGQELRTYGKIVTFDRVIGIGPKVTETSTVEIRYEIKTVGGVLIDSNRKSNPRNNSLVSALLETFTLPLTRPHRCS
jgi:hypothetical protein